MKIKLSEIPPDKGICGITLINGAWKPIIGVTSKSPEGIKLKANNEIYNDQNMEIAF